MRAGFLVFVKTKAHTFALCTAALSGFGAFFEVSGPHSNFRNETMAQRVRAHLWATTPLVYIFVCLIFCFSAPSCTPFLFCPRSGLASSPRSCARMSGSDAVPSRFFSHRDLDCAMRKAPKKNMVKWLVWCVVSFAPL